MGFSKSGRDARGFSMVELMVTILLVGILAAIVIPKMLGPRTEAKNTEAKSSLQAGFTAARSYLADNRSYANLCANESPSSTDCNNKISLHSLSQQVPKEELPGTASPADAAGAKPGALWMGSSSSGNVITGADPEQNTLVLCSLTEGGDTIFCIKDAEGVISYAKVVDENQTVNEVVANASNFKTNTDLNGNAIAYTTADDAAPADANVDIAPVNKTLPVITASDGTAVGDQLTGSPGSWTGNPTPTYSFSWKRCNSSGESCQSIAGADNSVYTLVTGDIGSRLKISVLAENSVVPPATAESLPSSLVEEPASIEASPSNTSDPYISGQTIVGSTLVINPGQWSGSPDPEFSYVWRRCDFSGSNCLVISGATGNSYLLEGLDASTTIRVRVTAANSEGSSSVTTAARGPISSLPVNVVSPSITGSIVRGELLAADPGSWSGYPDATYTFQWQRCDSDGANCQSIEGQTESGYTVSAADTGQTLRLKTIASNVAGSVSAYSAPTSGVQGTPENTAAPSISGSAVMDQTLSASEGSWTGTPSPSYSYQWQRCDIDGTNCSSITSAGESTYKVQRVDGAKRLQVRVTAQNTNGASSSTSDQTSAAKTPPLNLNRPVLSGSVAMDEQLSVTDGSWDGYEASTYSYQWERCNSLGEDCSAISGQTGKNHTISDSDANHTLRAKVTAENSVGSADAYSATSDLVVNPPVNQSLPLITGIIRVGQTLTGTAGGWSNSPYGYAYQWQRCFEDLGCRDIPGATSGTYLLEDEDTGLRISLLVIASNSSGSAQASSDQTEQVLRMPLNTEAPSISGSSKLGETLQASEGKWTAYPAPTSYQYQWQRCNSSGGECVDIDSASSSSYTLTADDVSKKLKVKVTAINSEGQGSATSAASEIIVAPPANVALPVLSGSFKVGELVNVSDGSWSGYPTPEIKYQWRRCDGAGMSCVDINGATLASYTLVSADAGKTIRALLTATNSGGSDSVSSSASDRVTQTPASTAPPTVTGTAQVGSTLSSSDGLWESYPEASLSYQWQVSSNGTSGWTSATGPGATSVSYTIPSADSGKYLKIKITAENSVGSASAYSEVSSRVTMLPANTAVPAITGSAITGQTLTASEGSWDGYPTPTHSYQWQISSDGSAPWSAATGTGNATSSYIIPTADAGKYLRIQVSAQNSVGSASAYSAASSSVMDPPVNTAPPAMSGTMIAGDVEVASSGTWTGTPTPTYDYLWQVSTDGTTGWTTATGSGYNTSSYTIGSYVGKYLRVQVSAQNAAASVVAYSSAARVIGLVCSGSLSISGTAKTGQSLSASGVECSGSYPTASIAYQWQVSSDGSSWASASGSGNGSSSYSVPASDASKYLRVRAITENSAGSSSYYSSPSSRVVQAPLNNSLPMVSGSAKVGQVLTSSAGSWDGYPTLTYTYQWQVSDNGTSGWASASGTGNATDSYTVPASDASKYLRMEVTAQNSAGTVQADSASTLQVVQVPENKALPMVSGSAKVGQILTSSAGSWDGFPTPTYSYQWQVSDNGTSGWASASGTGNATDSYTIPSSDAGKYLRMEVTAQNSAGEVQAYSSSTPSVVDPPANIVLPAMSGTMIAGNVEVASSGTWTGTPAPTYSYEWQISSDGASGWTAASGAGYNSSSYTIADDTSYPGKYLRVQVTARNSAGEVQAYSSSSRIMGIGYLSAPAVTGTARVGQVLSSSPGDWSISYPAPTYAYQWQVSDNGSTGWASATGTGNSSASYTVPSANASKYLRVSVTATNPAGALSASSSATSAVTQAPENTVLPAATGTAKTGQTLTSSSGSWDGFPAPTYSYQWQVSSDGSTGWASALGTGNATDSYTIPATEAAKYLRVSVTATNSVSSVSASSAATSVVVQAPANTSLPAVSGTAKVGQALSASEGSWDGYPAPTYAYQWQVSSDGSTGWTSATGTGNSSASYIVPAADASKYLRVSVTATNSVSSVSSSSPATSVVVQTPVNNSLPAVSGTAKTGQTLTSSSGSWDGYPTPSYAYQWQVSDNGTSGWASASGSGNSSSSYTIPSADASKYLRVQVTATNSAGAVSAYSSSTSVVVQAPVNSSLPAVSGVAKVGQALSASEGSWGGYPAPTYAYQWQVSSDGSTGWASATGTGNSSASYTVLAADASKYLRVQVTATNSVSSVSASSAATSVVVQTPVNNSLPSVSGTAKTGQTLTSSSGSWDGYPTPTYAYQWQVSDNGSTGWASASGVGNSSASYTVPAADASKYLRVSVTATNSVSSVSASSSSTSVVVQAPANTSLPAVSGVAKVGQALSASEGSWDGYPTPSYAYQWQVSSDGSTGWASASGTGNSSTSYTVPAAEAAKYLRVSVTATNSVSSVSASSPVTSVVIQTPVNTILPSVSGTAKVGQALSASEGSWDGYPTPTYAYQWQVSDNGTSGWVSSGGVGNSSSSYTVPSADAGKYLRAQVTATNSAGTVSAYSAATSAVTELPASITLPSVSGTATTGLALSAASGSWTGTPTPTYAYQWQVSADGIGGWTSATGSGNSTASYTVATADAGKYLRALVTATNTAGSVAAASSATAAVTQKPVGTTLPAISGTPGAGVTLNVSSGSWDSYPSPSYSYKWQRCTSAGSSCADIPGATEASYLLVAADNGKTVRAVVTATNSAGSTTANSAVTVLIVLDPIGTSAPTVSGTARKGSTLTSSNGSWSNSPDSYSYQWRRCSSAGTSCADIPGAASSSYLLVAADVNHRLLSKVTATNIYGSSSLSSAAYSNTLQAPENTSVPTISGTLTVGYTLTGSAGAWDALPTSTYEYQWQRSSTGFSGWSSIADATSSTYVLKIADSAQYIRLVVLATNSEGSDSANSASSAQIGSTPSSTNAPTVSGSAITGSTLTSDSGSWDGFPTPSYAYQWQVSLDGSSGWSDIDSASSASYIIATAQASKYLRVKVTATNSSGSASAYSSASEQVRQLPTMTAAPVLSGTARVGQSLSASAGSWDGFPAPSQSYQWQSSSTGSAPWADIPGAGGASFSPLTAQAGLYLRALITSTNSVGSASAPSSASAAVSQAPANTALPAVSGTVTVSGSLTASSGAWDGFPLPTYAYQWQVSNDGSTEWTSATGTGNATASYVPAAADASKYLRVQVVATNSVSSATANSAATSVVTQSPVNTVAPGISGTTQVAIPVAATSGTWTAYPVASYAYQWQVSANGSSGWTSATGSGSTTSSYTPAQVDIGQYLRVQVTAQNAAGSASALSSSAAVNGPPVSVSLPTVSGTATTGATLSASSGSWSGFPTPAYSYQWQVSDNGTSGWASASGTGSATSSYLIPASEASKYLRVRVKAQNAAGLDYANSAASSQVTQLPAISSAPAISGTARTGQTLNGSQGSWDAYPAATYAYQWQVASAADGADWASATGTGNTTSAYVVPTGEVAKYLRLRVTATNSVGSSAAYSGSSSQVDQTPSNTAVPSITGTAQVGLTVTSSQGSWDAYPAATYTYQWQVSADGTGGWASAEGTGNTTSSYTIPAADAGKYLRAQVTAANSAGEEVAYSAASSPASQSPANTALPVVSGTAQVGLTLSSSQGSWDGYPTPTFAYLWQVSSGGTTDWTAATGSGFATASYTAVSDDAGKYLRVRVIATNSVNSDTAYSANTAAVVQAPGVITNPSISGSAVQGSVLTASDGSWSGNPTPSLARVWYRCTSAHGSASDSVAADCSVIDSATASTYTTTSADDGSYIAVKVTATNSGGSESRISASTALIGTSPSPSVDPSISGSVIRPTTLTASDGSAAGTPTPTVASRAWYRCSSSVAAASSSLGASCSVISAASASTYDPVDADNGQHILLAATYTNSFGSLTRYSASTSYVKVPSSCSTPTISGSFTTGGSVTASASCTGSPTPVITYQWQTSSDGSTGWISASGTGNSTDSYTVSSSDAGKYLRIKVAASNAGGATAVYSLASSQVTDLPANTVLPAVSGTAKTGQSLTASSGTWTGTPAPTYAYQWQVASAATGATWTSASGTGDNTSSYTVASLDAGKYLRVAVTATNSAGSPTVNSVATSAVTSSPVNSSLPAITGTTIDGRTLAASSGTWSGTPSPTYTYLWQVSSDGSNWGSAAGAGGSTASYVIPASEVGSYLRVKVTATNTADAVPAYSSATAQITASTVAPSPVSPPVVSGTAKTGQSLTASSGSWTGAPTPTYSYQWQVSDSGTSGWTSASGVGNASSSYLIPSSEAAKYLRVNVTATNSVSSVSAASAATAQVTDAPSPVSPPVVSGTAKTGQSLTASSGSWTGAPTPTYSYQWQISATGNTNDWASATGVGNASSSYTVASADAGKYLRVSVTATNAVSSVAAVSAATAAVTDLPANTVLPAVSGTAKTGQSLTASSGTWTGTPTPAYAYQWQVASAATGAAWASATGTGDNTSSYTVASADAGKYLRVSVTATNSAGSVTVSSAATAQVTDAPSPVSPPVVSGTAKTGQSLTASSGSWTGSPTPTYSYQWQISATGSTNDWASATGTGSTSSSYTVASADAGKYLRVQVTATNSAGSDIARSAASASVTAAPINTALPAVSGSAQIGSSLSATSGTWTGTPTPTYAYQWQTSASGTGDWTSASGTGNNTSSYTVASDDAGKYLRVQVTATNSAGSDLAGSAATGPVFQAVSCPTPSFSGTLKSGQTLAASSSCSGTPTPTATYQWQVSSDGSDPWTSATGSGSSSASYVVAAADAGKYLRVTVTASNAYSSSSSSSAASRVYLAPANTSLPLISGTAQSGQTMTATSGSWTGYPNPTYDYQWQVSDSGTSGWTSAAGAGNNTSSYVISSSDAGKYLRAQVTATNLGGPTDAQSASSARLTGLPVNTTLPAISGSAQAGQDLTATSGSWDGYPAPTYSYQWQVSADGSTGWASASGAGATGTTYTAATADAGKYLRAQVTATNSVGTGLVAYSVKSSLVAVRAAPVNTALPVVSGTAQTGLVLSSTAGTWSNSPTSYAYQWQTSSDGSTWASAAGTGNASSSYTVASADAGKYLRLQVTAINETGSAAAQSTPTALVTDAPYASAAPSISGSALRGSTLTASDGSWSGAPTPTLTRTWYRCATSHAASSSLAADCSAIASVTASTYATTASDDGKYVLLAVTATNSVGSLSSYSASTALIGTAPSPSADPSISGSVIRPTTLTASDGSAAGTPTPTVASRAWYRCSSSVAVASSSLDASCSVISAASASTYDPVDADNGQHILLAVTYTNSFGSLTRYSVSTAAIQLPPSCSTPTISGSFTTGDSVTASASCSGSPAPTVAYQWQTSSDGSTGWASAAGVGNSTGSYTVASADAGKYLRIKVTATNTAGSAAVYSSASSQVTDAPANTVLPAVSGTAKTGQSLTASSGTWTGTPTPTYAYQWQVASAATGATWTSATGVGSATSSYTVASLDAGNYLRVRVTATNAAGSVPAYSASTVSVVDLPVNTVLPVTSGGAAVGTVAAASSGSWTGTPAPTYTYQWQVSSDDSTWTSAAGTDNASASYTIGSYTGQYLRVQVTATNAAGSVPVNSASFRVQGLVCTGTASVAGIAKTGNALTGSGIDCSSSYPTATLAYQWQVSSDGSTGWTSASGTGNASSSYTVASADASKYLRVQVAATNSAGTTTYSSSATSAVTDAPVNTVLPAVTGSAKTGQTLTASSGSWTGTPTPSYSYQWQVSSDGSTWASAAGTGNASSSYTVPSSEIGKYLRVQVTAANTAASAVANSAATTAVTDAPVNTVLPAVSGTAKTGQTLTSTSGTWTGTPTPTYTYLWQKSSNGSIWTSAGGVGNATSSYTVASADAGNYLRVQVTATNSAGSEIANSGATAAVTDAPVNTALPAVSGTMNAGSVEAATSGTWTGTPTPTYTYLWQVSSDSSTWTTGTGTGSATSSYTMPSSEIGKYLRVQVTATNTAATVLAYSSSARIQGLVCTGTASVAGIAKTGNALTGSGIDCSSSYPTATLAYQWQVSSDGSTGWASAAGTGNASSSYTVASTDASKYLRVQITATNSAGTTTYSSSATSAVTSAPANSVLPAVSGTAKTGQTLTASSGTWSGTPTPTYTYQWQVSSDGSTWASAAGTVSNTSSYLIPLSESSRYLRVQVTATNSAGPTNVNSAATVAVISPPVSSVLPTVSGTTQSGSTLTATSGTWTGFPSATYAYQWQVSDSGTSGWASATGAGNNTASYVAASSDAGKYLRAQVTATNSADSVSAQSASSARLTGLPVNIALPVISGSAQAGQDLTATSGSWDGYPAPTYSYQWQLSATGNANDWASASGAGNNSSVYTAATADAGKYLRAQVTATNSVGTGLVAYSVKSSLVAARPAPVNTALPVVSGTAQTGLVLSSTAGSWSNSPTSYAYQWQVSSDGSTWASASGTGNNSASYTVSAADSSTAASVKYLRVQVTATNESGSTPASSASSAAVTSAPVNTAAPAASGSVVRGSTLTASSGTWTGYPTPTYAYKWYRCTTSHAAASSLAADCSEIVSAAASTYLTVAADDGQFVLAKVTATNSVAPVSAFSATTAAITYIACTTPVISGTMQSGQIISTLNTCSGTPAPTVAYQWQVSSDGSTGWASATGAGSTSSSYTIAASDSAKYLRVQLTAVNTAGTVSSSSAAALVVQAPANTALPVVAGTTTPGSVLTSTSGTWTGSPTLAYQWMRCDLSGARCTSIGTSSSTYTLVNADASYIIKAQVTGSNAAGSVAASSAATSVIASASGCTVTTSGLYTVHSCTTTGSSTLNTYRTLSADYLVIAGGGGGGGTIAGGGGGGGMLEGSASLASGTSYTASVGGGGTGALGWNNAPAVGTNGSNSAISGAGLTTITSLGGGGGGSYGCGAAGTTGGPLVGGSGGGGGSCANTTGAAGTASQGNAGGNGAGDSNAAGGGGGAGGAGVSATASAAGRGGAGRSSSIAGTATLYGGGGGGGVRNGTAPGTVGAAGTGGGGLGNALDTTLAASNINGTNGLGGGGGGCGHNGGSANRCGGNGGSGIVVVRYQTAATPANTVLPTISGTANSGNVLTGAAGTWTGEPTPTLTYQWQVASAATGATWSSATGSGATSLSYTVASADISKYLRLTVTGTSTSGITTASSSASSVVTNVPVNSVVPTVTGAAIVAGSLSAGTGSWTGGTPTSYSYQWQVASAATGATWTSATGTGNATATYVPAGIDAGQFLRVSVIANSATGSSVAAYSVATAAVAYAPINTVAPAVSGSTLSGQTLTATSGTWTGLPTPTYTYQWQVASAATGAAWTSATGTGNTSAIYTPSAADASKYLRVTVTAANTAGAASASSNVLGPVQFSVPTLAWGSTPASPVVTGTTTSYGTWTLGGGAASSVECQAGSGAWGACTSSTTNTWTLGAAGSDTVLNVRAINLAGTSATLTKTVHRNAEAPTVSIASKPPDYYWQTGTFTYTATGAGSCSWYLNDAPWGGSTTSSGSCSGGSIAISAAQRGGQGYRRMTVLITNADGSASASAASDWYSAASSIPNGNFETGALAPHWSNVSSLYGSSNNPEVILYGNWILRITNVTPNNWGAIQQAAGSYNRCDNIYWESWVNYYTTYAYVAPVYSAPRYTAAVGYTAASYYAGYYTAGYTYASGTPRAGAAGVRQWVWNGSSWNLYSDYLDFEDGSAPTARAIGGGSWCGYQRLVTLLGKTNVSGQLGLTYFNNVQGQNAG